MPQASDNGSQPFQWLVMRMLTDSVQGSRQGFNVAYLKARFFLAAIYQPLKRLATIVTPRWGFVLQLVLRRVEANKVRAKLEFISINSELDTPFSTHKFIKNSLYQYKFRSIYPCFLHINSSKIHFTSIKSEIYTPFTTR